MEKSVLSIILLFLKIAQNTPLWNTSDNKMIAELLPDTKEAAIAWYQVVSRV